MSPDYFFSAVLLRSLYPYAPIRQSLLLETQKFLRQQSPAAVPIPASTDKHPLFTFAATYIQNVHDSHTFVSNPNPHKSTPTPPQNRGANNGGGGRYKPGGLELAAAASTTTPAPPALPLLLPPILARIPISTKARPSTQELSVPYLALFFTLPTYIFKTMQTVTPNVTSPSQLSMTSAATAFLSTLLPQLSPVNLCAHLAFVPAVTTTVTTVLAWCLQTHTTSGVLVPQHTAASGVTKD